MVATEAEGSLRFFLRSMAEWKLVGALAFYAPLRMWGGSSDERGAGALAVPAVKCPRINKTGGLGFGGAGLPLLSQRGGVRVKNCTGKAGEAERAPFPVRLHSRFRCRQREG